MAFLEWSSALKIGVHAMDEEHRVLVELMNRLHRYVESGAPRATVASALQALFDYTVEHFREEEAYMRRIGFSGYRMHCITHQHLVSKLAGFRDAFVAGTSSLDAKFFSFLKLWLSAHILEIDKKYVEAASAA